MSKDEWSHVVFPVAVPGAEFTMEEIARHNTRESCYLVAGGRVLDVTTW